MTEEEKAARREARVRPTVVVLHDLKDNAPLAWEHARIVGRWVWIEFPSKPDADTLAHVKAAGFHWNKKRRAWQHPCGHFSLASAGDPRFRYGSVPAGELLADLDAAAAAPAV